MTIVTDERIAFLFVSGQPFAEQPEAVRPRARFGHPLQCPSSGRPKPSITHPVPTRRRNSHSLKSLRGNAAVPSETSD